MKKRLFLILLFSLVSCGNEMPFDKDYEDIAKALLLDDNKYIKLEKEDNSNYDYKFDYLDIRIKAYYTELKSEYTYAFVLVLSYKQTKIEDIRLLGVSKSDENRTYAYVGFKNNKIVIDSYNDSNNSIYKGIQLFITPYNNECITRFYLETSTFSGTYFEINDVKEIKR